MTRQGSTHRRFLRRASGAGWRVACAAGAVTLACVSPAWAADRIIVGFEHDAATVERRDARDAVAGRAALNISPTTQALLVRDGTADQAVAELEHDPHVRFAEVDGISRVLWTPNDPRFFNQASLHNTGQTDGTVDADVDAPEAWDVTRGSSSVLLGILDTGVNFDEPDFGGRSASTRPSSPARAASTTTATASSTMCVAGTSSTTTATRLTITATAPRSCRWRPPAQTTQSR